MLTLCKCHLYGYAHREAVVWFDYKVGKHSGPGEVFIIPDMGDTKNQTQCKCHDRSAATSNTVSWSSGFLLYNLYNFFICVMFSEKVKEGKDDENYNYDNTYER
jgi:hypothetical protein